MMIRIENTLDENIKNFYPDDKIIIDKASEFVDSKSLRRSPLAEAIFDIGGIESILIATDMVSVKKNDNASWEELSPQIMAEMLDFIASGARAVISEVNIDLDSLMEKISILIDARIRPLLNQDGGDIAIKNYDNDILYVELLGKCAGCPYAMRTLKEGVENILKRYIPQIKEVKLSRRE